MLHGDEPLGVAQPARARLSRVVRQGHAGAFCVVRERRVGHCGAPGNSGRLGPLEDLFFLRRLANRRLEGELVRLLCVWRKATLFRFGF